MILKYYSYICTRTGLFCQCISKITPFGTILNESIMEFGEYIRAKRKLYNLTQLELAERSGVGVRFVRELERGKATVQLDKVNMVLALFGEELRPAKINSEV